MTIRKLKKLLREYPYAIDDTYMRSYTQAKRLYETGGFATMREIVARAKADSRLPPEDWADFERAALAKERRDSRKKAVRRRARAMHSALRTHRRLAVASAVVALILAFFTLVPASRALAKEIFDYILGVFGSEIQVVNADYANEGGNKVQSNDGTNDEALLETITKYESLEDFAAATRLSPFTLNLPDMQCISIIEQNSQFVGRSLKSQYGIGSDGLLVVTQRWSYNDNLSIWTNGGFDKTLTLTDGTVLYYSIDKQDGSFDGACLLEDSLCQIYINKEPYISQVIGMLQRKNGTAP